MAINLPSFLQNGESPFSSRRSLIYLAAAFLFVPLGFGLGLYLTGPLTSPSDASSDVPETIEEPVAAAKVESLSGYIQALGPSIYEEGTHQLIGSNGLMLAVLKSRRFDLEFFENQWVEVEGKISAADAGGTKLLTVEKVRIK